MARSFFSRLAHGGESAPLAPPRPVSNLWKRAQIDAAAAAPPTESLSDSRRSTMRPSIADPAQPLNPAEAEGRPAPQLGPVKPVQSTSMARASQTSVPRETLRPAPQLSPVNPVQSTSTARASQTSVPSETLRPAPAAAASAKIEAAPRDSAERPGRGQPNPTRRAREPAVAGLESRPAGFPSDVVEIPDRRFLSAISSAPSASSRRELPAQPLKRSPSLRPVEAKPIPTEARRPDLVQPNPRAPAAADRQPMLVSREASRDDGGRATQPLPTPTPVIEVPGPAQPPQARLQPVGLAVPLRSREPSLRAGQSSGPEEQRPAKGNTVQIGKIEVQIVPPPASNYRPAPPSPPKARLARGYALWPGW